MFDTWIPKIAQSMQKWPGCKKSAKNESGKSLCEFWLDIHADIDEEFRKRTVYISLTQPDHDLKLIIETGIQSRWQRLIPGERLFGFTCSMCRFWAVSGSLLLRLWSPVPLSHLMASLSLERSNESFRMFHAFMVSVKSAMSKLNLPECVVKCG